MEHLVFYILSTVVAYLLGSIPTSVWIGRWFFGIDIREHGSGNAGTTNTFRVLGVTPGIVVFIVDIFKGWLAVSAIYIIPEIEPETARFVNMQLLLGSIAVAGHIFPIYVGFKGGKGVATMLGAVLAIHPLAALMCFGVFTISLLISKYVSLSSMLGGLAFPFFIIFLFKETILSLIIFSILVSILLILTHQKNIVRLMARQENKVSLRRKHK